MTQNLVVVAHPDDEILGIGGTAKAYAEKGEIFTAVMVCSSVEARNARPADNELRSDILRAAKICGFTEPVLGDFPNLNLNAVSHLSLVQFIEEQIRVFKPTRIFTHHPGDLNDDHRQVSKACLAACRLFQRTPDIQIPLGSFYFMEVPSATDWSFRGLGPPFEPDTFVDIVETFESKILGLEAYRGVMRPEPHPRSKQMLKGLHSYRGGQSGYLLAESFQTVFRCGI